MHRPTNPTPVTPYKYEGPTRRDATKGYEAYPAAARLVREKVTARDRHAARVEATKRAVEEMVNPPEMVKTADDVVESAAIAAALIALDLPRHKARWGHPSSTQRMRWASGLGSGRWLAHDGEAWAAAARDARDELLEQARTNEPLMATLGVQWDGSLTPRGLTRIAADYLGGDEYLWIVACVVRELRGCVLGPPSVDRAKLAQEWVDALREGLRGEEITPAVRAELARWDLLDAVEASAEAAEAAA